jgi:hypothetical protein
MLTGLTSASWSREHSALPALVDSPRVGNDPIGCPQSMEPRLSRHHVHDAKGVTSPNHHVSSRPIGPIRITFSSIDDFEYRLLGVGFEVFRLLRPSALAMQLLKNSWRGDMLQFR